jgi:hypothetical protein
MSSYMVTKEQYSRVSASAKNEAEAALSISRAGKTSLHFGHTSQLPIMVPLKKTDDWMSDAKTSPHAVEKIMMDQLSRIKGKMSLTQEYFNPTSFKEM